MDASGMPKKKKKKVFRSLLLAKKDISLTKVVAQEFMRCYQVHVMYVYSTAWYLNIATKSTGMAESLWPYGHDFQI